MARARRDGCGRGARAARHDAWALVISRNSIVLGLGILVSAVFLWLALRGVDAREIAAAFARARPAWALPLLLLLAGFCLIKAWRWAILLGLPVRDALLPLSRAVLVGYAATSLFPLQLGELARVWAAARAVRMRIAPVLVSVAVERVLDLLGVLIVLGAALLFGGSLPPSLLRAGYVLALGGLALIGLLAWYVARTEQLLRFASGATAFLPPAAQARLLAHLRDGASGAEVLRQPRAWFGLGLLSISQWGFMAGCIAASLAAFDFAVPLAASASVLGLTILAMSLPSGPGYVGSIQLAFTLGLAPFAIGASDALAASLFYHVLVCGSLIAAGLIALHRLGGTLTGLRRAGTDASTVPVNLTPPSRDR